MYTFVYLPGTGTRCQSLAKELSSIAEFQCPHGLELLPYSNHLISSIQCVSMPSRAWVVTIFRSGKDVEQSVSMPSRAWVVTKYALWIPSWDFVSMPSRAWVVTVKHSDLEGENMFQCPHGLELLLPGHTAVVVQNSVSMPSWAWVVTGMQFWLRVFPGRFNALSGLSCYWRIHRPGRYPNKFQCPLGLELLPYQMFSVGLEANVSMPSRAWVVTVWPGEACGYAFTFQCPHGLELLLEVSAIMVISLVCFNALTGLSCYYTGTLRYDTQFGFNALTGLSCYRKNVQYFKFFMILFMHPCYLYVYISIPSNFFQPII